MKRLGPMAVAGIAGLLGAGTLALGASKTPVNGGIVHVYIAGSLGSGSGAPIVITGAIADAGKFIESAPNSKVILSEGSFKVDDSKGAAREREVFAHLGKFVDPKTCGISVSYTASAQVKHGTGAYKGITGTVKVTTTDAGVFPKRPSSKCNLSKNAQPIGFVSLARGSGHLSFK